MQLLLKCLVILSPCFAIPLSDSSDPPNLTSLVNSPTSRVHSDISVTPTPTSFGIITTDPPAVQLTASATTTVTCTTTVTMTDGLDMLWKAPNQYSDLTAYNITGFPAGQQNLAIVTSIPSTAYGFTQVTNGAPRDASNSTSMLQILYPAHSINPRTKPQGGAEFYATPLNITDAQNVTLTYSVFFPANFDYVLAGKLPGLYGGHGGCSGGYDASDCFSTRLMWRKGGLGELYLYAPKDKQTQALCADPQSVCDTDYGFSVGRGSYTWAAGHWTTVSQTVRLNTPGHQDGCFTLDVNEIRVISRHDIFYRGVPSCSNSGSLRELDGNATCADSINLVGRILWGFVDGFLALIHWYNDDQWGCNTSNPNITTLQTTASVISPLVTSSLAFETTSAWVVPATPASPVPDKTSSSCRPVGFIGLFFSTFFGGHDDKYATPRDQLVWFKDFRITYHS